MTKWTMTLMVSLVFLGVPLLIPAQEKPGKPDQPDKPAAMEQQAVELQVVRDAVATGIIDREPIDAGQVFSATLDRIYYFTEVQSEMPTSEITHVWYYGDREMARVTLPIEGSRWRTWSSKQILPGWTGQWKVEAVTMGGAVAASQPFSIEAGAASEPQPVPARESGPAGEPEKK